MLHVVGGRPATWRKGRSRRSLNPKLTKTLRVSREGVFTIKEGSTVEPARRCGLRSRREQRGERKVKCDLLELAN